jgi:NTE family protein
MRRPHLALAATALLLLTAPATAQDAPAALAPHPDSGRVALVLGGGAARGAAHVGVLRALTEAGVPIDLVLGTSMGSLIGGLYAAGFAASELAAVFDQVDPNAAAELLLPPRGGVLDGRPLAILLDALVEGRALDATEIPFYPVVIDLETGEPQAAPSASLADAIRASTAIPVLFDPVEIDGRFYYDGGLKQTISASLARALGAEYVIAVDVTRTIPFAPGNVQANLSRIFLDIVEGFNEAELEATDVVIDPGLRDDTYMDFARSGDFVRAGEAAARAALPGILEDLATRGIALRPPGDPNEGRAINDGWRERLAAARREVALRPRPWNLGLDLGFDPTERGARVTPAVAPPGSRLRFGVDLRDGPLGRASVGASYAVSVTGGSDAVVLRAAWRATYGLEPFVRADWELAGALVGRLGVRWRADPGWSGTVGLRVPVPALEAAAAWRGEGVWFDAAAAHGLGAGWTRGHAEVRGAAALAGSGLEARARLLVGIATPGIPAAERFSVGPATGLRTLAPDAFGAERLATASFEVAVPLGGAQALIDAALVTPSAWGFADVAWAGGGDAPPFAWGAGVGAGVAGTLFGFVPFDVGVDAGYGAPTGTWRVALRAGAAYPVAWRR